MLSVPLTATSILTNNASDNVNPLREKILPTASDLLYALGIRAVGVDLVVDLETAKRLSAPRRYMTRG